jgi:methionyl-tRNA synthetase
LPKLNLVHGFINDSQGLKFSKSMGNGILPRELVAKFGIDGTRFIMLAEMNDLDDTNFDWNQVTNQYNSLLANNLGNLVMRVSNLVETMLNGIIDENYEDLAEKIAQYNPTLVKLEIDLKLVYQNLEQFQTQDAIKLIFNECSKINEYLEQTKPWSLIKDSKNLDYVNYILSNSSESLKEIGKALSIFLPETGDKIYKIFSAPRISKAPLLFTKVEVEKSNLQ